WYFVFYFVILRTGIAMIGAPVFMGLWAAWAVLQGLVSTYVQAAFGFAPEVAHWAHVGGFAAGLGGALALGLRKKVRRGDLVSGRQPASNSFETLSQVGELEQLVKTSPQDARAWYA
ncbi:MAG: rhomboid family intramembrane serine protease, partial [Armatimonadetes bacterium]|nr:rhomboid family intramembrane serine protease [Armatimonadota bacterium]NIM24529.1 rhomboid family intramembrane serine protease [Armatimonadota bacterium]NIM68403.1 rhomboid family intramembrane serine protease [Armatimonadota bacterium]NIM76789.1 rhomboid family intramembrane serine protease [Armatimonadota bacterium]NIN06602.1 rhomboid family intramembrane serine protease [Armatimonadota bacterium]